jgi:hypothetical protein
VVFFLLNKKLEKKKVKKYMKKDNVVRWVTAICGSNVTYEPCGGTPVSHDALVKP